MEWQPIETAPKTGERILLYQENYSDDPNMCINVHSWKFMGYTGDDNYSWYTWVICEIYGEYDGFNEPTHWMPLPEKPNL